MKQKKVFPCEIALLEAMIINPLCVSLLVKSNLGVSTLSSVPLAISKVLNQISYGNWNFIFQSGILIVLMIITHKKLKSCIVSFGLAYVFGILIDFYEYSLSFFPDTLSFRIIYFIIGFIVITYGASLFILCQYPILPFDSFVRDISDYFHLKIKYVKTCFDFVSVITTMLIGLLFLDEIVGIGIGTILGALFTGVITQKVVDYLKEHFEFKKYRLKDMLCKTESII